MKTLPFFSEEVLHALGWTLAHSLWQATLAALMVAFVLPRLKQATQRYWLAYGALLGVLGSALLTFWWVYEPEVALRELVPADPNRWLDLTNADTSVSLGQQFSAWFEAQHGWLVGFWLTGFALLLLRFCGGLWQLRRIERAAAPLSGVSLHRLAAASGLRRPVRLLETAVLHTPAAFGWLRPVVLFPVGLVCQLTPAEMEAVLAHELAHLARRDWLMNLLQALVEALFYFHPAVWWLSATVRAQREQCCDELAVAQIGGNRLGYARALLHVQEFAAAQRQKPTPTPMLALGADGGRSTRFWLQRRRTLLLERVQLILLQSPTQQNFMLLERLLTAALLVAALTCWGLRAAPPLPTTLSSAASEWLGWQFEADQIAVVDTDSVPKGRGKGRTIQVVEEEINGQKVAMTKVDGRVTDLAIDGKTIAEADYPKHQDLIDRVSESVPPPPPPSPAARPGFPAPPAPPAPPTRGQFWEFPAPTPRADVRIFNAPAPPPPPMPPGVEVQNDQDANGNRIIRVKRGEEEVQILVNKDGKVLVDGAEVANGASVGVDKLGGASTFIWTEKLGEGFPEPGEPMVLNFNEEMRIELDKANQHRDQATIRIEQLAGEQDLLIQRADEMRANQDLLIQRADEMRANQDARRAEMEIRGPNKIFFNNREFEFAARGGDFSGILLAELQRDYLVTDPRNYSVELTGKKLKVNGKKQPDNMHQKYLELYRRHHGEPLSGKDGIKLEVRN